MFACTCRPSPGHQESVNKSKELANKSTKNSFLPFLIGRIGRNACNFLTNGVIKYMFACTCRPSQAFNTPWTHQKNCIKKLTKNSFPPFLIGGNAYSFLTMTSSVKYLHVLVGPHNAIKNQSTYPKNFAKKTKESMNFLHF